jgi:hypothetical protein
VIDLKVVIFLSAYYAFEGWSLALRSRPGRSIASNLS